MYSTYVKFAEGLHFSAFHYLLFLPTPLVARKRRPFSCNRLTYQARVWTHHKRRFKSSLKLET